MDTYSGGYLLGWGMIFVAFILGPYIRRMVPPESRTGLMAAVGKRFSYLG